MFNKDVFIFRINFFSVKGVFLNCFIVFLAFIFGLLYNIRVLCFYCL